MSKFEWQYISPIKDETIIDALEIKYHYALPSDLKDCIIENNAGMPNHSKFDLRGTKDRVFGGLLSFNEGDADSIYDFIDLFMSQDGSDLKIFPFGLDPFGNFYCIKDRKVVFYNHESGKSEFICDSFTQFLNALHD